MDNWILHILINYILHSIITAEFIVIKHNLNIYFPAHTSIQQ